MSEGRTTENGAGVLSDVVAEAPIAPSKSARRSLPFLIKRQGTWLYQGSPIQRKEMVCMFASMLRRDKEGHFWLKTPREEGVIQVEDAPFTAVELNFEGSCGRHQTLSLRTNIDEIIFVNAAHPLITQWRQVVTPDAAPVPYVQLRPGDGDFPILARLTRAVYFELAALAVPGQVGCEKCMGVWSDNCFFPLAPHLD